MPAICVISGGVIALIFYGFKWDAAGAIYNKKKYNVKTISNFTTRIYLIYFSLAFIYKYQFGNGVHFFKNSELSPIWKIKDFPLRVTATPLPSRIRLPPTSVLDMTLNNLMVRFQLYWALGNTFLQPSLQGPLKCTCTKLNFLK